ncbi:MAG: hypothetical protein J0L99_16615 [Chitinophagales bacterium]|nr:hypothetical protein [Chitinophagales bacterium]
MRFLLFLTLSALLACNKETPPSEVVDTAIDIQIENQMGENLLNEATNNAINPDAIKLMYLIDGKALTVYNTQLDCPSGFCRIEELGFNGIRIFPNDVASEAFPITYIDWGNGDTDTIKCQFERGEHFMRCSKVWVNETLSFPDQAIPGLGRAIKIVK